MNPKRAEKNDMCALDYRQPILTRSLIASLDLPRHICEDCSSFPVECLNEWNVKEKIRNIIRLTEVLSGFLA
jgi:hypothetical protein